ncbi:MAG TPA: transposase [Anaerolineae bacterium]|nr:transposase [Anaerolineae bacterium]
MSTKQLLQQFRDTVYRCFEKRGDAALDLLDALTSAAAVESPVALSTSPLFRRVFSSVYDVLTEGRLDEEALRTAWYNHQPRESETIAGYEVYGVDATPRPYTDAPTLPEAQYLKTEARAVAEVGYKYSWVARLVQWGTSWVAPQAVARIGVQSSDSATAVAQVQALDRQSAHPKVVVGDSLYANKVFLAVFLLLRTVVVLVRLRGNRILYEQPPLKVPGTRGAPRKHGAQFQLANPARPADLELCFTLGRQRVHSQVWYGLHFYALAALVGSVLRLEFLKADGTPRYQRPLWLFWTGERTVLPAEVCRMYLWRFAIEHAFRFLKQHLGLNANQSTDLRSTTLWMQFCATAYYQLLLLRPLVQDVRPAWYPRFHNGRVRPLTPRQVQMQTLAFLLTLDTPAQAPKRAGKGHGRAHGHRPPPKPRFRVQRKTQKRAHAATDA